MKMSDIMRSKLFPILFIATFASMSVHARIYTIGQNNTTSTYGENIHFSFGSDSSRQTATIENAYWNGERTPVDVIFSKGSEAGQTGEFYFTPSMCMETMNTDQDLTSPLIPV